MNTNVNPETEVRYGIISAQSLHDDVIQEIQSSGRDIHWEEAIAEIKAEAHTQYADGTLEACDDETNLEDIIEDRIVNMGDKFFDEEPVHEFEIDGVKGRTTWLGGAMLVWVFFSPYTTYRKLCSPCVPNCGDLDSPVDWLAGNLMYDVPPGWRI